MSWRKPELRDIAAKLNQKELDMFRQHPDFQTGADPVLDLLEQTAESVRGFCRANRQIALCPRPGTIPEGLMTFAMDFAAFDVLKRINVKPNEARTDAWEKAHDVFAKVAPGEFIPESWSKESTDDASSNRAVPAFSTGRRRILDTFL